MNEKNFHSKIEADFSTFLKSRGFPDGSLIYEPTIVGANKRQYRPDFLVIDPENNERLAVIEVKSAITSRTDEIVNQLNTYKYALGDLTLPAFIVTPSKEYVSEIPFDLFSINKEGNLENVDFRLFPNYKALSSKKVADKKEEISAKKDATINSFQAITGILAGLLVLLVIADFTCTFYKITLLTTERMALLGAAVALVVIPYAQKFKGLGIEWERATAKKDKSS